MDSEIEAKVREFVQKRSLKELQEYVRDLNNEQISRLVLGCMKTPNFSGIWNYLLQSLDTSNEGHSKRLAISLEVMRELENSGAMSTVKKTVTKRLCEEFPRFKTDQLVDLCNLCVQYVQKGSSSRVIWKDVLPELLNVLSERDVVEYDGDDLSGLDYKEKVINNLCSMMWTPNIVIALAIMFIDMPLNKEEHSRVVSKLCSYMDKLTCTELPAFAYQLLKLCKNQNGKSIFICLQSYFDIRIYSKPVIEQNSETMDLITEAIEEEYVQAESNVLYHINQAAVLGYDCIKDYINSLKHLNKSPEYILHPFQLTVLLTISSIENCEEKAFEIIKSSISRSFNEANKKNESLWLRETINTKIDVEAILKQVIKQSFQQRDFVLEGLVNLAFVLLSTGAGLGRDEVAEKQWHLGTLMLFMLIKEKRHIAPSVIMNLCDRITTSHSASQYIECIHLLTKKMALVMLENQNTIIYLIDNLMRVSTQAANNILDAVLPLTKISSTIRDHLILVLRKALISRMTDVRQVAVMGFMKLLKKLKITNLAALSQTSTSSSSGHSVLTQISLNRSMGQSRSVFSNEALCLEVLGILKKCFSQQAEVRVKLYDGFFDAIVLNPELTEPILDVLWGHFSNFYVLEEDKLPPLHFEKITLTKDVDVALMEPLGKLIYTMGIIITKNKENSEDTLDRYVTTMESLCTRMKNCELIHLELDDASDLLGTTPESQQKLIILKEVLNVFEALIGYKINSWTLESESQAEDINSLFQSYNRFSQFYKNLSVKPKKGDKRKKGDGNKTTTTQQSQGASKNSSTSKSSKLLKTPKTVLNFQDVSKTLHLLLGNVPWASPNQANSLKTKVDVHRHMMQATVNLISSMKSHKSIESQNMQACWDFCEDVFKLLYGKCIKRMEEFFDFDSCTAASVAEVFYLILQLVNNNFKEKLPLLFKETPATDSEESFLDDLSKLVLTYQELLEIDFETNDGSGDVKNMRQSLVSTYTFLCSLFPAVHEPCQVLEWLRRHIQENTSSDKNIPIILTSLRLGLNRKFKNGTNVLESYLTKLLNVIGVIDEEASSQTEDMKMINEGCAFNILQTVCSNIKTMLDDVDWIILRLKSEHYMITYPGCPDVDKKKEDLQSKEKNVCCQMCLISSLVTLISKVTAQPGSIMENILKLLIHYYNTSNNLTKYFMSRSSRLNVAFQTARFERVVKVVGKQVSPTVYKLFLYVDEIQKPENSTTGKKAGPDPNTLKNKVLKETRLIPKVVYEMEQFSRSVIQLSSKTKVDLSKYVGQGTTRDFRLLHLKEVVHQARKDGADDVTVDDRSNVEEEEEANVSEESADSDAGSESQNDTPPKKKSKK